jgi:hypothetical protein
LLWLVVVVVGIRLEAAAVLAVFAQALVFL